MSGPAAEDFGVLLDRVRAAVGALQEGMSACAAPTVSDLERFKAELEDIQKGDLARLCASGSRAVARHGVEGMARLFSPLSGAERKLNRAWAAMVDKHWPEAEERVGRAQGVGRNGRCARDAIGRRSSGAHGWRVLGRCCRTVA